MYFSKTCYPLLSNGLMVQPRKTGNCPDMTEKMLTGMEKMLTGM